MPFKLLRIILPLLTNTHSSKPPFLPGQAGTVQFTSKSGSSAKLSLKVRNFGCLILHSLHLWWTNYPELPQGLSCLLDWNEDSQSSHLESSASSQHFLQLPEAHVVAGRGGSFFPPTVRSSLGRAAALPQQPGSWAQDMLPTLLLGGCGFCCHPSPHCHCTSDEKPVCSINATESVLSGVWALEGNTFLQKLWRQ